MTKYTNSFKCAKAGVLLGGWVVHGADYLFQALFEIFFGSFNKLNIFSL